jgi:esterase
LILHVTTLGKGTPVALLHGLFGIGRNLGTLQRALAARHRVLALDLRNHGDSAHAAGMTYPTLAADVLETLARYDALPCALLGHSMGGKVAMRAALDAPDGITRLLVADIAPVPYGGTFARYAAAMRAVALEPGLTRAQADAAMQEAVPEAAVRGFLLQNLRFGETPSWRIGLDEIIAALPDILDWPAPSGPPYPGPVLFVAGARSDYIRPTYRLTIRAMFPQAGFVTLKDAGHWVHADNPDGFRRVVEAFLD